MTSRRVAYLALVLAVASLAFYGCGRQVPPIDSAESLVDAMRARYADRWYRTLVFTQETIRLDGAVADTSIWYEAISIPGKLRIDIAPTDSGNGLLFVDDHRYVFQRGRLVFDRAEIHPLLILGFDVYASPTVETLAKLDSLGVDVSIMHENVWNDRPVYVVGANAGDLERTQFWIDKQDLLFVRLLQPEGGARRSVIDVRFEDYEVVGEGWVAPRVDFFRNDTLLLRENYFDIAINVPLSDSLFDPAMWRLHNRWMLD